MRYSSSFLTTSLALMLVACSQYAVNPYRDLSGLGDMASSGADDGAFVPFDLAGIDYTQTGCLAGPNGCYTVYAHGDHFLYLVNLMTKTLESVGPFKAPMVLVNGMMYEDTITDLAVAPNDVIFVASHTKLYTASPVDGHVTLVGSLTSCGVSGVALSFSTDGHLYSADYMGALCRIDISTSPPTVTTIGTLGGGMAISGDIVVVNDGTMYGTAYKTADSSTISNNLLVKLDPLTGKATIVGSTGFPRLYGTAFALGQAFGFTHDSSGRVVTIDPKTGVGTLYNTFLDPMTGKGIAFAGAGVNPMVQAPIM